MRLLANAVGLALCIAAWSTTAAAQGPAVVKTAWVLCSTADPRNPYYSAVFPATVSIDGTAMGAAWIQYLKVKYNFNGFGICQTTFKSQAEAEAALNHGKQLPNFKQTDWTYVAPPSAAAAPASGSATAAAAPAAAGTVARCRTAGQPFATGVPLCVEPLSDAYVVCSGADASPTAYLSATFAVTAVDNQGWINGFTQFLAQRYGFKGAVGCNQLHADSSKTFLKNRVIGLRANNKTVVETGWTFNSAPAVAVEAPPPPPAAAPRAAGAAPSAPIEGPAPATKYAVCRAEDPRTKTAYFGAPFTTTTTDNQGWSKAYRDFLMPKYGRVGAISCRTVTSLAAAQQLVQTWEDAARVGNTIVETGWKFE